MTIEKAFFKIFFDKKLLLRTFIESLTNLNPRYLFHNPVLFVLFLITLYATVSGLFHYFYIKDVRLGSYILHIASWLWFSLFFSNFSEALGKRACLDHSIRLKNYKNLFVNCFDKKTKKFNKIQAVQIKVNDTILIQKGDIVPVEALVIEGQGYMDESSVTGQSTPVLYDKNTNNTLKPGGVLLSDQLLIRATKSSSLFISEDINRFIKSFVRHKSSHEINLNIFLGFQLISTLIICIIIKVFNDVHSVGIGNIYIYILFAALLPTTIGGLITSVGISSIHRTMKDNMLVKSMNVVEKAGQIDILLLDKTGTVTFGQRRMIELTPLEGVSLEEVQEAAHLTSLYDNTQEGKSIIKFLRSLEDYEYYHPADVIRKIDFTFETKLSGLDLPGVSYRKGEVQAIEDETKRKGGVIPLELFEISSSIAHQGGTPLALLKNNKILGVIHLEDVLKPDMSSDIERLHDLGIQTIMVTGDNEITTRRIAQEIGIKQWRSSQTPQDKLNFLTVAMCGDGYNDLEVLAQADVGMAMRKGNFASCEAANVIDLSSHPGKMADLIEIGRKQLLTRGALLTFSTASDFIKYIIIFNMIFLDFYKNVGYLNFLGLHSFFSVLLSVIIFNTLTIFILIPKIFKGVKFLNRQMKNSSLSYEIIINGAFGLAFTIIGIKIIDFIVVYLNLI
jgi:K+-transporting ATPase ATPase B chain